MAVKRMTKEKNGMADTMVRELQGRQELDAKFNHKPARLRTCPEGAPLWFVCICPLCLNGGTLSIPSIVILVAGTLRLVS